ncbi:MAG: flippase-like domain-containing protein [Chlamydiae bacterium]|nr:flippase-like domain-containing protein [Chlamydiota bacterium]MBI3277313.1 flippase-like domain-containing protein [Chlamydiota bacterium]
MSCGILFYVFTRPGIDFQSLSKAVKDVPFWCFSIAGLLYGAVLLVGCLRWWILLHSFGIRTKFNLALQLLFIGLFFNNMMPSLTGGDVVKAYYTAQGTSKKFEAVASILLDRVFGFLAMFILATIGALLALKEGVLTRPAEVVLVSTLSFFLGLLVFLNLGFLRKFSSLRDFFKKWTWMEKIQKFYDAFTAIRHNIKAAVLVFILSLFVQSLLVIANFVLARGLGITEIPLKQFFILIPMIGCVSALPVSFAGWGIGEGAYRTFFMMVNPLYGATAVFLSIFYRLISLGYSLVGFPLSLIYRKGSIEDG